MQEFKKLSDVQLPDIDLYVDQVLTILDQNMESYKIDKEDKIMTKNMVNNYVKSKLIDKPEKKKYNKSQLMQLIMIYHMKSVLNLVELDVLFEKALEEEDDSIASVYEDFVQVHDEVLEEVNGKEEELRQLKGREQIKELFRTITTADLNKRIAERILNDFLNDLCL